MQTKFHLMLKTELVIFKFKRKQFDGVIKLKLSRNKSFPTDSAKHLGVKIDGNRRWEPYIDYLSCKYRANTLLFYMKNYLFRYIWITS